MADPTPADRSRPQPAPLVPFPDRDLDLARPPVLLTAFVGREREVAAVLNALRRPDVRLLTLTGPGGVGKTRLALRVAAEVAAESADGVAFVPLAPVLDPRLVAPTVAQALGVRDVGEGRLAPRVASVLRGRELLLVLDNFEHVLDAAGVVVDLLTGCPTLKILATSRAVLHISGEYDLEVPPLSLSEESGVGSEESRERSPHSPLFTPHSEAVRLFAERARAAQAAFAVTEDSAPVVAAICARLEGLPLAIELAAAQVNVLPPRAMLTRLERRLPLLTGGPRDAPDRLRTMRNAIAWSHDLLTPNEQVFFRRLAVFAGGVALESAAAVCEPGDDPDAAGLDMIRTLVDKSLLHQMEGTTPRGYPELRFAMLETVREFGLERLAASGEAAAVRRRHAGHFLALAERAEPALYGGRDQVGWLDRLAAEHDNLRAALAWAIEEDPETALRLAGALFWFWYVRGHLGEGRWWLGRALAAAPGAPDAVRARALLGAGMLADRQGDDAGAAALLAESLALSRALGDPRGTFLALGLLGVEAEDAGDYGQAALLLEESLAVNRAAGDLHQDPLAALTLAHLGVVAWGQGDPKRASALLEEALAAHRADGDAFGIANALGYLGLLVREQGSLDRAAALLRESLALFWDAGSPEDVAVGLASTAALVAKRGESNRAARLFGAAEALHEAIGGRFGLPERAVYERATTAAQVALGETAFAAAWAAGRVLPLDQAVIEALDAMAEPAPAQAGVTRRRSRAELTPREQDVVRLLVAGRTDREIADALFISPRTAQHHVGRLFAKLGVGTRTAAVAAALRSGLVPDADPPAPSGPLPQ